MLTVHPEHLFTWGGLRVGNQLSDTRKINLLRSHFAAHFGDLLEKEGDRNHLADLDHCLRRPVLPVRYTQLR